MMTKPAAKRPKAPPGSYTRKAHEVRAKAAKQTSDVVTAALEWCLKEKKGSRSESIGKRGLARVSAHTNPARVSTGQKALP